MMAEPFDSWAAGIAAEKASIDGRIADADSAAAEMPDGSPEKEAVLDMRAELVVASAALGAAFAIIDPL
jgi:hypothetical protein